MSTNEANSLCSPRPPVLRHATAPLYHAQCLSHDYTVPVSYLSRSSFWIFFSPSFFVRHQSEPTRHSSVHVAPRGALSGDKSSFLLLKPGKCPAENPFALHCTVVEQRVLTGCTAVFSHPCAECQPQRNSNSGQK